MHFLWPHNLWWMLVLPLLPAAYLWLLRRRARPALGLPSPGVVRPPADRVWRQHLPPALILAALALLALSLARPAAPVTLPWAKSTIWLAMDISRSMRVRDVQPTRMVAAQEAAKAFLAEVPRHVEVGLVTFAGTAQVAQAATLDRAAVAQAIDAIQMQFGTAIGNGLVLCLAELFPDHGIDLEQMIFGAHRAAGSGSGARSLEERAKPARKDRKEIKPVPPGSYDAAAIILLTDGRRATGVDTFEAAKMAADRGVRVYVIGLGTPDGHLSMGEGMAFYLQLDEATLRQVATMTGGEYHHAASAEALRSVYLNLGSRIEVARRETELTALVALAAVALLMAGAGLSVMWFARVA
ncbi:MAG: VWA domain-containing protein [Betaproteobacteria bacterium]|nr:VWA domain-containing protein [Betaproteobacteria bacterium]